MAKTRKPKGPSKQLPRTKNPPKCSDCGFNIRSKGHEKGAHHRSGKHGKGAVKV